MLHQIAEDYKVGQVYVLDMYRHGKVSFMLAFAVRVGGVGIILLVIGLVIVGGVKKAVRSKEKNTFEL